MIQGKLPHLLWSTLNLEIEAMDALPLNWSFYATAFQRTYPSEPVMC